MRWGRRPRLDVVLYLLKAQPQAVQQWAATHHVPGWVQELPGGWCLFRTVTVGRQVIATTLSPQSVLLDWAARTESYLIQEEIASGVSNGAIHPLPDDLPAAPWERDDPRARRGVVASRGDHLAELTLAATGAKEPIDAVLRDGWTLVPHENAGLVCELIGLEDGGSAVGLLAEGDELNLWLTAEGDTVASWDWSVMGVPVATDRLPLGEVGAAALEAINPPRLGVTPFVEHRFAVTSMDTLAQVLATPGTTDQIVPALVQSLGLPDAVRTHLLGLSELTDDPDATLVQPAASMAAAIGGAVAGMGRTEAMGRSPRRRLVGAIGGAVFIVAILTAAVILIPGYLTGAEPWSWWDGLRLVFGLIGLPIAAMAVWNWWRLRGVDSAPPVPARQAEPDADQGVRRWLNRRGPATALSLLLGVGLIIGGIASWQEFADLRDHGIQTNGTIVSIGEDTTEIEFRLANGQFATAQLEFAVDFEVGEVVPIVYDPQNPQRMELADVVYDVVFPWIFGGIGALLVVVAALTWRRVIDLQKIDDWIG